MEKGNDNHDSVSIYNIYRQSISSVKPVCHPGLPLDRDSNGDTLTHLQSPGKS